MGLYGNLTLGGLKQLLAQHAPVLYMHPRDKFMPCSVEWFMDHSELWLRGSEQVIKPPRCVLLAYAATLLR